MPKRDKGFHEHIVRDLLGEIPDIMSRPMSIDWGIYQRGVIFAIIADGVLYFKVDEKNKRDFMRYGSKPFSYTMRNGKIATLSYRELPEAISEDKMGLG